MFRCGVANVELSILEQIFGSGDYSAGRLGCSRKRPRPQHENLTWCTSVTDRESPPASRKRLPPFYTCE